MIDPVESKNVVSGSNMAKVADGPNPGKTPTSVPKRQPMKQYNKLAGCRQLIIPLSKSIFVAYLEVTPLPYKQAIFQEI